MYTIIVVLSIMFDLTAVVILVVMCFFFQAEDGIRDLVRSRGLGDVYKRQRGWHRGVSTA